MIELRLKYKCTDGEAKLSVREREDEEDIRDYMEYVERQIGAWHVLRSCSETKLEYLPARDDARIGEK